VNFAPYFVARDGKATIYDVADHIEHIAKVAGKKQWVFAHPDDAHRRPIDLVYPFFFLSVGIGSDFDGIGQVPVGLEDVSKYPELVRALFLVLFPLLGMVSRGGILIRDTPQRRNF
jgi:membrane dipeptidase